MNSNIEPAEFLSQPRKVVTVCHVNPDGDAIGASMAVYHLLKQMRHVVQVVVPNDFPQFLKYLEDTDTIIYYDRSEAHKQKAIKAIEQAEAIFALDFNDLKRVGELQPLIEKSNAYKVMIDHHLLPQDFADFVLSDTSACSTAELVYRFIENNNWLAHLNQQVVDSIYMGILTDTGKFSHSVSKEVHNTVGKLIEAGADVVKANEEIYNSYSFGRVRFWGFCLGQKMRTIKGLRAAVLPLSVKEMHKYNVQRGDTEGLVNQPLSIKNVDVSILLKEEQDKIKLSLRSKGDFSVNEMARTYFNGGGHSNASGGSLKMPLLEAVKKVESVLHLYEDLKVINHKKK